VYQPDIPGEGDSSEKEEAKRQYFSQDVKLSTEIYCGKL